MFSDRSGRENQCRDRRCSSRCDSNNNLTTNSLGRRDRTGYGREGRGRLADQPMLYRRRGFMGNNLLDSSGSGLGGLAGDLGGGLGRGGLGGGLGGGLPRDPMIGRGAYGARGSPSLDPRMPYMDDDIARRRRGSLLRDGLSARGMGSQDRLLGARAAMMGGLGGGLGGEMADGMSPGMGLGQRSPYNSPAASSIFDPQRMDRPRMPYGPHARAAMGNYRSPYAEDHESEMEAEMMDRAMMEREFIGPGDEGGYYGYGDGNEMGGQYNRY